MTTPMHFPMKLYELVDAGPPSIVSWSESGSSFLVTNAEKFCSEVLPRHFRHSKMTSFQRQLNLYGFHRISKGADAGRYRHALFMRGRPDLVSQIKREPRAPQQPAQQREQPHHAPGGAGSMSDAAATPPPPHGQSSGPVPHHPAFGGTMAEAVASTDPSRGAEKPAFDTENAALAMLNMSRADTMSDDSGSQGAGAGGGMGLAESPGSRRALSDANIDAQINIGAKLQQSLSRQSSLEAELTTLRKEMLGMNRTIEALARTVQMQRGTENMLTINHMVAHEKGFMAAAEDRVDGVHQVKRRRSSESDVDLSALQLNSPTLSSDDGSEEHSDGVERGNGAETPLEMESIMEMSEHGSECAIGPGPAAILETTPGEKRRCESSSF